MLISDVIMADMNGIDAAIKIRGMLPRCKILLFCGQAATADLGPCTKQGYTSPDLATPVHPDACTAAKIEFWRKHCRDARAGRAFCLLRRLEFAAAFDGAGHGDFVGVFDVAAGGTPVAMRVMLDG